jgi:putative aldouronate transport system permease protein
MKKGLFPKILGGYQLYLLLLPAFAYLIIYRYIPLYGIQIAFRDYIPGMQISKAPWVGLAHFKRLAASYAFGRIVWNTVRLSLMQLLFTFPLPILVALLLNQLANRRARRIIQTVIYAPHFISTVVVVGMMYVFFSIRTGLVNKVVSAIFGTPAIDFLGSATWFTPLYIGSTVWQTTGWSSIIYLGALSTINPELHESAVIDGAGKLKRILHIDLPGIMPTAVIMLILSFGQIMSVGFDKAYLMQNPLNMEASEIISTYVYKVGMQNLQYSYSAAVDLLNSVVNLVLLLLVNGVARRLSPTSLL